VTLVDKKQTWRNFDDVGLMKGDTISLREETLPGDTPLLQQVMQHGTPLGTLPTLQESCEYFRRQIALLPEAYKALDNPVQYPVSLSQGLTEREARVEKELHQRELGET
jgi:Nicotinate phosphoribosyltransferase C-terminal domain